MSTLVPLIISDLSDSVLTWMSSDVGMVFCGIFAVVILVRLIFTILK